MPASRSIPDSRQPAAAGGVLRRLQSGLRRRLRYAWACCTGAAPWSRRARAAAERLAADSPGQCRAEVLRVRAAFDAQARDFPDSIDPADGRVQAVGDWCARLPPGARVADVGCGTGRYLRLMLGQFPAMRFIGIDLSAAMLARLPPGVAGVQGSLLHIPLADAAVDGALAVESLEHALLPQRAAAELCRIVRPGGWVLVIDKDLARQPLSHYEPWERWFAPDELTRWLEPWCDAVTVQHVPHLEGRPRADLFLAAAGRRRG